MIGARRGRRPLPFAENLTVLRPAEPDDYGDAQPGTSFVVHDCVVVPRSGGRELVDRRDTVVVGLTAYAPLGADVRATDVIARPDGTQWQVIGEPGTWQSAISGQGGIEIALERVTG